MKSLKHLTAIFLSASLIAASTAQAGDVIAIIDGKSIDNETFSNYVMMRSQQVQHNRALTNEQREILLQEYINSELLYNAAIKDGVDQQPEVIAEIEMQKRTSIINNGLKKHLNNTLTEALLMEAYRAKYGESSKEYHIRHILVEHETDVNNVIAALKRGEDFKKLAGTVSIDPSSGDGGNLGWMGAELMPAGFLAVIATLEPGDYASQPVESSYGWHIIQLEEIRTIAPPPIEAVANMLAESLQSKVVQDYIKDLRSKAKIEIK